MRRSRVLIVFAATVIGTACAVTQKTSPPIFDVIITGGRVIDGTGAPWFRGDVGIVSDRIAGMSSNSSQSRWVYPRPAGDSALYSAK